jgi:hypothetical protein
MPARRSKLYIWQPSQLSSGLKGLDAKVKKEIEANEGSTVAEVFIYLILILQRDKEMTETAIRLNIHNTDSSTIWLC